MKFQLLKNCNCCERHQKNKPKSLYTGWTDYYKDDTGQIKDHECQCTCRQNCRQMAREDRSIIEVYFNPHTTDIFVRLPGEKVPADKGLNFLATATWKVNTVYIDPQYWNNILHQFGNNDEIFDTTWMYQEIYNKLNM